MAFLYPRTNQDVDTHIVMGGGAHILPIVMVFFRQAFTQMYPTPVLRSVGIYMCICSYLRVWDMLATPRTIGLESENIQLQKLKLLSKFWKSNKCTYDVWYTEA